MRVVLAEQDHEIQSCYHVMAELRPHIMASFSAECAPGPSISSITEQGAVATGSFTIFHLSFIRELRRELTTAVSRTSEVLL